MSSQRWSKIERHTRRLTNKIANMKARRWVTRGEAYLAQGDLKKAVVCGRRSLDICADFGRGHVLMAKALMPNDGYLSILSRLHESLGPESYVEIGVASGRSLALVGSDTKAVGIDPYPCINRTIKSRAKLYPIPSDVFFASYDLLEELGTSELSLAFIDGLHRFEQVLKDFINLEQYADEETIVLIHDCLPVTRLVAARERATGFWCGDVWKIIPCLRTYRPRLSVHVVSAQPSGLGIVTNLDPRSAVLPESFDQIVDEFRDQDLDYDYLEANESGRMNILPDSMPYDWPSIAKLLSLPLSKTSIAFENSLDEERGDRRL